MGQQIYLKINKREELEQIIAGCLLISYGECKKEIDIDIEDFKNPITKLVLEASKNHETIDPVIVSCFAKEKKEAFSVAELSKYLNAVPTEKNIRHYVCELKKEIFNEKFELLKLRYSSATKDQSTDTFFEMAQMMVYEEHQLRLKYLDVESGRSLIDHCADLIDRIVKREPNKALLKTGWTAFDELNGGGFLPNEMVVIAARPSIGKTAAALQLISSEKGIMFALEMDKSQIAPRLLARVAKQNTLKASRNPSELTDEEQEKLLLASSDLIELAEKLMVYDEADQTLSTIRRRARKAVEDGAKFIIIDYLQLLEDEKAHNRERAVANMSRGLKNMSKELGIPVFVLAQLNRGPETENRAPKLSDLRESGAIEQDANVVIFIYTGETKFANSDGSPNQNLKEAIFFKAKGRATGIGVIKQLFNANHQTFYDWKD